MSSQTVTDLYPEPEDFKSLLAAAWVNASNKWEEQFTTDMHSTYERYGGRMYLSDAQQTTLERIATP